MSKIGFVVSCVLVVLSYLGYVNIGLLEMAAPTIVGFVIDFVFITLVTALFGEEMREAMKRYKR